MRREDGGFVSISDTCDIRFKVLVGDDRYEFFKRFPVGLAGKSMAVEVFDGGILGEDIGEDMLLDIVGIRGDIFYELKRFLVFFS